MKLSRLGEFIEIVDERNTDNKFDASKLMGISVNKELIKTKADTLKLNLKSYKILEHDNFAYCLVTSRNGNKISLVYNNGQDCIISSINPVFKVIDKSILLPEYLMMFFKRPEFDRLARYNSWGSARETFSWDDMCDVLISVPSLEIQQKYVNIYKSLIRNMNSYKSGLDDLKLVCDGFIEDLRKNIPSTKLKPYIKEINEKNSNNLIKHAIGISTDGVFDSKRTAKRMI